MITWLYNILRMMSLTDRKFYIELTMTIDTPSQLVDIPKKRPEVRCDSESTAQTVVNE